MHWIEIYPVDSYFFAALIYTVFIFSQAYVFR